MRTSKMKSKIYLIYHDGEIYAHTPVKEYKDRFLSERNKDMFYSKKVEMSDIDYAMFKEHYDTTQIIEISLSDIDDNQYKILATLKENLSYKASIVQFIAEMEYAAKQLMSIHFKEKHQDLIRYFLDYLDMSKNGVEVARIKGYELFMKSYGCLF